MKNFFIFTAFIVWILPIHALHKTVEFDFDGYSRRYIVHVPKLGENHLVPLVLFLHGAGGRAEGSVQHYGWVEKADKESFIVAFPEAMPIVPSYPYNPRTNPNVWNAGNPHLKQSVDDIGYLRTVIEDISNNYPVDPERIYVTGFSDGASMTFFVGVKLSDIVAAIAPVSGHLWLQYPHPSRPMSVQLITGADDPLNPLEGGHAWNPWNPEGEERPPMITSNLAWLPVIGIKPSQRRVEKGAGFTTTRWGPTKKGLEAIFIAIDGQGHEWPGGARMLPKGLTGNNVQFFNATDAIWDFFKAQTKKN